MPHRLVRGLDYYCHTAFEFTSCLLGAQSTVCGGGRYDGLIEQLGGSPTPAIVTLRLERLLLLIQAAANKDSSGRASQLIADPVPDVYVVNRGYHAESLALVLSRNLRNVGVGVELDYSGSSFGKQLKRANRCNAPWALIIGDLEVEQSCVRLKSLRSDVEDQLFGLDDIPALLKAFGHLPDQFN